jgi:hypothetical protein
MLDDRPGSSSRKSSGRLPCQSPSTRSIVVAGPGANGRACRLVKMLSRPNMVMNQGLCTAGQAATWYPRGPGDSPGCDGSRDRASAPIAAGADHRVDLRRRACGIIGP